MSEDQVDPAPQASPPASPAFVRLMVTDRNQKIEKHEVPPDRVAATIDDHLRNLDPSASEWHGRDRIVWCNGRVLALIRGAGDGPAFVLRFDAHRTTV